MRAGGTKGSGCFFLLACHPRPRERRGWGACAVAGVTGWWELEARQQARGARTRKRGSEPARSEAERLRARGFASCLLSIMAGALLSNRNLSVSASLLGSG